MNDWVSINGTVPPASEGTIPIYDRGSNLYGDRCLRRSGPMAGDPTRSIST